jgi:hypothetical protein
MTEQRRSTGPVRAMPNLPDPASPWEITRDDGDSHVITHLDPVVSADLTEEDPWEPPAWLYVVLMAVLVAICIAFALATR